MLALTEDGLLTWPQVGLSALLFLALMWSAWYVTGRLREMVRGLRERFKK